MAELKPCPFCGCKRISTQYLCFRPYIICEKCHIQTPSYNTYSAAVKAWNRRVGDEVVEDSEEVEIDPVKKEHSMTRKEILAAAEACVCGQREEDYGSPEDNFHVIAELWAAYIEARCVGNGVYVDILPEDVACMMALLKIARIAGGRGTADCWIDLAGYAACGGEITGGTE